MIGARAEPSDIPRRTLCALAYYQRARDEAALPLYGFTCDFATRGPPPVQMQQLLAAIQDAQDAQDAFVSVMAATLPAPEVFAPANVARLLAERSMTKL